MISRSIDSEAYWRDEFAVTDEDMEAIYSLLLEKGVPQSMGDLAEFVLERRFRVQEEERKRIQAGVGRIFQPKEHYQKGDRLFFPAMNGWVGRIIDMRAGENPEVGPFDVIQVQFEGDRRIREFAANYPLDHRLNEVVEGSISSQDLYQRFGGFVRMRLRDHLEHAGEFINFGTQWLLEGLLTDIHVGLLNIAEAMIVITERPLPTAKLLEELDLPAEIPQPVKLFSLNYVLNRDSRFVNQGTPVSPLWNLVTLQS